MAFLPHDTHQQWEEASYLTPNTLSEPNISSTPRHDVGSPWRSLEAETSTIRLVTLLPGPQKSDSTIHCELEHFSLSSPPESWIPYEGVSYTCGSPWETEFIPPKIDVSETFSITLNKCIVPVAYNLHAVLHRLRYTDRSRTLWIDALCIDQSNMKERSAQVRLMHVIYRRANRVLCWLGEQDDYSDLAFDTVEELCWATKVLIWRKASSHFGLPVSAVTGAKAHEFLKSAPIGENLFLTPGHATGLVEAFDLIEIDFASDIAFSELARLRFGDSRTLARYILSDAADLSSYPKLGKLITALERTFHIYTRTYWQRVWIVQECIYAKEGRFICGDRELRFQMSIFLVILEESCLEGTLKPSSLWQHGDQASLGRILAAVTTTNRLIDSYLIMQGRLALQGPMREILDSKFSLKQILRTYDYRKCTEPRDAVYALLNIATPIEIVVDYEKKLEDVYAETAAAIINQDRDLNILCEWTTGDEWTIFETYSGDQLLNIRLPSWVPNLMDTQKVPTLLVSTHREYRDQYYRASGHEPYNVFDRAVHKSRLLPVSGYCYTKISRAWPKMYCYYKGEDDLRQMITTVWNQASEKDAGLQINDFWRTLLLDQYIDDAGARDRTAITSKAFNELLEGNASDPLALFDVFKDQIIRTAEDKSFCITAENTMAMVGCDVEIGDLVYVLRGASCPFVVRPHIHREAEHEARILNAPVTSKLYKFVGPAYVQGVMDGEAWDMMSRTQAEETLWLA